MATEPVVPPKAPPAIKPIAPPTIPAAAGARPLPSPAAVGKTLAPKPPSLVKPAAPAMRPPAMDEEPFEHPHPVDFWQRPWVQNVLPLITSVSIHATLIILGLLAWGVAKVVQAQAHQDQTIIPDQTWLKTALPAAYPTSAPAATPTVKPCKIRIPLPAPRKAPSTSPAKTSTSARVAGRAMTTTCCPTAHWPPLAGAAGSPTASIPARGKAAAPWRCSARPAEAASDPKDPSSATAATPTRSSSFATPPGPCSIKWPPSRTNCPRRSPDSSLSSPLTSRSIRM